MTVIYSYILKQWIELKVNSNGYSNSEQFSGFAPEYFVIVLCELKSSFCAI